MLLSVSAVAVTTLLIYPLREAAPEVSPGVVYLLAVLLVAVYWGLEFGLLTSALSAAAFNFFHIPPTGRLTIAASAHWVALGVFLVAATVASVVANLARTRAAEAERRREEADLAAGTARVLLGGATLADALPQAGALVGKALGIGDVEIVLDPADDAVASGAVVLDLGAGRRALLVLGADVDEAMQRSASASASRPRSKRSCGRRWTATGCRRRSSRRRRCGARTCSRRRCCGRSRTTCARR